MFLLDNLACADDFPLDGSSGGAQLIAQAGSNGGYVSISGADVRFRLGYSPDGVVLLWTPELRAGPGNIILEKGTRGIQLRNAVAGVVATVSAALAEPVEPSVQLVAGGNATTDPAAGVNLPAAIVNRDTAGSQSIPDSTLTPINWGTASYDSDGFFSAAHPTRLTIPTGLGGVYQINACCRWGASAAGTVREAVVRQNNTVNLAADFLPPAGIGGIASFCKCALEWPLAAGDYIELSVYQDSGAPLNAQTGFSFNDVALSITRLRSV